MAAKNGASSIEKEQVHKPSCVTEAFLSLFSEMDDSYRWILALEALFFACLIYYFPEIFALLSATLLELVKIDLFVEET